MAKNITVTCGLTEKEGVPVALGQIPYTGTVNQRCNCPYFGETVDRPKVLLNDTQKRITLCRVGENTDL